MKYQEHKDKLAGEQYNPLPNDVCNQLVINNQELDRVANSMQRLIVKCVEKTYHPKITADEKLFEMIQIANASLAESLVKYDNDKIDFAYYAYVSIQNSLIHNYRTHDTVRPRRIKGELKWASYDYLDEVTVDDEDSEMKYPLADDFEMPEVYEIDFDLVFKLIKKNNPKFKKEKFEIYCARVIYEHGAKEVAQMFDMTTARVYQIIKEVEKNIKESPAVLKYLKEFI